MEQVSALIVWLSTIKRCEVRLADEVHQIELCVDFLRRVRIHFVKDDVPIEFIHHVAIEVDFLLLVVLLLLFFLLFWFQNRFRLAVRLVDRVLV